MALAATKECTNSNTILVTLHSFMVVCLGPVYTLGQDKQTWVGGGPGFRCCLKSPLMGRPSGAACVSYLMARTLLLPLGTLGLKGRNTCLKVKKLMVPLCCLPKGRRQATAEQMFYLEPNIDKEMKRTETCNVADDFSEVTMKKRSRMNRRRRPYK